MSDFMIIGHRDSETINELCTIVTDWAEKKGWNDDDPKDLTAKLSAIALMHSELSECVEYIRTKVPEYCPTCAGAMVPTTRQGNIQWWVCDHCGKTKEGQLPEDRHAMDDKCKELTGEAAELADVLIRIFHYCGKRGINLGEAVRIKHAFNCSRPYKHGKRI